MAARKRPSKARRTTKVTDEIVRELQSRIARGELAPGDQLPSERQLADQLGASRGSVREALRALELAGLVYSRHGGGNFVAQAARGPASGPVAQFLERQHQNLRDLYEARQMLEPRLAFVAADRATAEALDRLREALARQEQALAADDPDGALSADRRFHEAIARATQNQTFIRLHNFLSDLVAESRREAVDTDSRRRQAVVDHRAIFEAIEGRDAPAASTAMLQHLKNVEAILLSSLSATQDALSRLPGMKRADNDA